MRKKRRKKRSKKREDKKNLNESTTLIKLAAFDFASAKPVLPSSRPWSNRGAKAMASVQLMEKPLSVADRPK